jgi:predicted  nucleic acid-binding Zn-ribbon protein
MLAEQKAAKTLELLEHIAQQLDSVYDRFNYKTDPEIQALKVSPEPHEVLQVMEDAVKAEALDAARTIREAVKEEITGEFRQAVRDVTGEVDAVRDDIQDMGETVKRVARDVKEVKEEVKMNAPGGA